MAGFGLAILLIGPRAIKLRIPGVGIVLVSFAVVGLAAYRAMTIPPGKSLIPGLDLLDGRTKVWNLALQPFHANPWLGGGPDVFDLQFRQQNGSLGAVVGQAHNQVIQALATGGVITAVALIATFFVWIAAAARRWRSGVVVPAVFVAMLLIDCVVESPMQGALTLQTFMTLATLMMVRTWVVENAEREAARWPQSLEEPDPAAGSIEPALRSGYW